MNVFHIGDPVLITGGGDKWCRANIGKATLVTSEALNPFIKSTGKTETIYMVEESQTCINGCCLKICYRPFELMLIKPLDDEVTEDEDAVLLESTRF